MASKSPMLAASFPDAMNVSELDLKALLDRCNGLVLGSTKLDGIRAIWWEGTLVSRSLKPIANMYTRKKFSDWKYAGLDGELILGAPNAKTVFEDSHSAVMTQDGAPQLKWYIFDNHLNKMTFQRRAQELATSYLAKPDPDLVVIRQRPLTTVAEILAYEEENLKAGYEGIILRDPLGAYKYGRSTLKQSGMIKMKRFSTSEAVITGYTELMRNANEATISETGHQVRSSHKEGMVPAGMMGTIIVKDIHNGMEFEIGSGFDVATRQLLWINQATFKGVIVEYKYLPYGTRDKPRHPIFLRFRSADTLSPTAQ